ncbi:response regulator transcription factor [Streptomyces sp. NPDC020983]|uniref:response regulator transcription factor n=1 Tax=Streptomyces sp. NPDC020983 TaxID=3365106 RepID=UPI003795A309
MTATKTAPYLAPAEERIVVLMAQGHRYAAIAAQLYITPDTVKSYRRRAMKHVGARTTSELIALAIGYRLIPAGVALPAPPTPAVPK